MSSVEVPVSGPCEAWVTGDEVAACCNVDVGTDFTVFDQVAIQASMLLFELSGRQFNGTCEQTIRPCRDDCACWGDVFSPAQVPAIPWSWGYWGTSIGLGWGWGYEGCRELCGCGFTSRVKLPGFPVTSILEVKIDGVVIADTEYRLDEWQWLTRMNDARWPACQQLDRADTEEGTWTVTYEFGQAPPLPGVAAAAELACQLYKACEGSADCQLPAGTTKVTRQGVQIERAPFLSWALKDGAWATGLPLVDVFLSAYNPFRLQRRSTVWSPDVTPRGERIPNV